MAEYDNLDDYKMASAEEKLVFLKGEMIRWTVTIKTQIQLIEYKVSQSNTEIGDEIETSIVKVIEAVDNLEKLREFLIEDQSK